MQGDSATSRISRLDGWARQLGVALERTSHPHRPKRIFDRDRVAQLRAQGLSIRAIAKKLEIGVGTAVRTLQAVPKDESSEVDRGGC